MAQQYSGQYIERNVSVNNLTYTLMSAATQELLQRYRVRQPDRRRESSSGQRSHGTGGGRLSPISTNNTANHAVQGPGAEGGVTGEVAPVGSGSGDGRDEAEKSFPIRNMNVMNPLDPSDNQIENTVNRRRAARMHSLLQVRGVQNMRWRRCAGVCGLCCFESQTHLGRHG